MSHTPAPWFIDDYGRVRKAWGGSREVVICETRIPAYHEDRLCGQREESANASLIAAAPELLEALKLGLEFWSHRQQRYKNRSPVWVQQARAAIAKATAA